MEISKPKLGYSELAAAGIKNGQMYQAGGVVRLNNGRIFEILKPVNSKSLSSLDKTLIGTGIVVGITVVGYGVYKLVTFFLNKKKLKEINNLESKQIVYVPALTNYYNKVQTHNLALKDIKEVINFFEKYGSGNLGIEISNDELKTFRNVTVRYANKLLDENPSFRSLNIRPLELEAKINDRQQILNDINEANKIQRTIFAFDKNQ